jgi:hypothetical protein
MFTGPDGGKREMSFRRTAAVIALTVVAGGGAVLATSAMSSAATPPAPTPISLNLTGMASAACPLPLNGSMAVSPGTTVQFTPDLLLNALSSESLTIKPAPDSTDAKSSKTISALTKTNGKVGFTRQNTYSLSWKTTAALGVAAASQTGKLIISSSAQKCVVAVQVPTPSVSVPVVPSGVNSTVNGIIGSAVGGVNGALGPVNSAVGPILGSANSDVGAIGGGGSKSGSTTGAGKGGSTLGTIYKPTGLTVAQRTVPQGGGSGIGGLSVTSDGSSNGSSVNAPSLGFVGTDKSGKSAQTVKSGGSPNTVELAANKPRSALNGFATLILLAAVLALSGATVFYARTYLLNPLPAKVKTRA